MTQTPALSTPPPRLAADHPARRMLEWIGEPAWLIDGHALHLCAANAAACTLLGLDEATLARLPVEQLIPTPEDTAFWLGVRAGDDGPLHSETVLGDAAGARRHVSRRIHRLGATPDLPACWLVQLQDRSTERAVQDEQQRTLAELQATLESTADGILVTDGQGAIRSFNHRFALIWGLPSELLSRRQDAAVHEHLRLAVEEPELYARRLQTIGQAALMGSTDQITLRSGRVLERVSQPLLVQGRPCGRVWAFRDRTELVRATHRIEQLASSDPLTGLPNRHGLGQALALALQRARTQHQPLAVLVLDLDHFQHVNDGLGASVGDQLLQETAERLRGCVRHQDLVARLGGDQFALLLREADQSAAETTARRVLQAVGQPHCVEDLPFTLTASIGVALYPVDAGEGDVLLAQAEAAMRRAKLSGRECYRLHQPEDGAGDRRHQMRMDHAMRQGLAQQRFRLHYQPQVDLVSGRIVGAEALLRWRDPELGEVSPAQFIPVAEASGFIIALGDWVLRQAVWQAAQWQQRGLQMPVSVNVSALQFQQAEFVQRVADTLAEHGLAGELLELELTESLLQDGDETLGRLAQLSAMGVRLAIDDFGTGYSSLSYLKRMPLRRLKIDRSFVRALPQDESDAAIVRAIVQLARTMELTVIAEGVENEVQRRFLQDIGCDEFQGFLCAPALDVPSFEQRLVNPPEATGPAPRPRLTLVRPGGPA
ncbi:putative bifunctional diguanylate cyclase/phosphodiesterase [Pseudaquabacterium rugosum]|uniref:EAL domain-containing protein n=1 Tax=Pseudaquabacterium rugosum TaxID=2984194 RepID=A0ABU9B723_9BURK